MCPQNNPPDMEYTESTAYPENWLQSICVLQAYLVQLLHPANIQLWLQRAHAWVRANPGKAVQAGVMLLLVSVPMVFFLTIIAVSFIITSFSFVLLQGTIILGALMGLLGTLLALTCCFGLPLLALSLLTGTNGWVLAGVERARGALQCIVRTTVGWARTLSPVHRHED